MEWNKEYHKASGTLLQLVKNTGKPSKKPNVSNEAEIKMIFLTNKTTSAASSEFTIIEMSNRSLN